MSSHKWRMIIIAVVTLIGFYSVAPTVIYFSQPLEVRTDEEKLSQKIPSFLPRKHVKLGLDIQGGVQLVLGVDTEQAVENRLGRVGTEMARWAKDKGRVVNKAYAVKGEGILRVELGPEEDVADFKEAMGQEFGGLEQANREGQVVDFRYEDDQINKIKQGASKQAIRVVRGRVDKWGVSEPVIAQRSDGSIMVQLPGFKNPERAKELLGRTAQLKFKIVDDKFDGLADLINNPPEGVRVDTSFGTPQFIAEDKQLILDYVKGKIPVDKEMLFERKEIAGGKKAEYTSVVVGASTEISGEDVLDANVTVDPSSFDQRPAVSLKFTGAGGKRFAEVTGSHVKERMAIVLDEEVVSAPTIQQKISGGTAQITLGTGGYDETYNEANQLALILKSGALPAKITIEEERQVGATLGPELAKQGVTAVAVGLIMVLVFMLVYYRRPGAIACLALVLNALLMLAGMTAFGFSLTLPGIAGFILTLGMAVDANVLINERIRQEMKTAKNAKKAIETGFARVFWTIIDANVTTMIAALVLLETNSSGPIRGFAVTLLMGLIVSMFTSLYCTRTFFMVALKKIATDQAVRVWVGAGAPKPLATFDFLAAGKKVVIITTLIALASIGSAFTRGINWSVDFAGGTEIEIAFNGPISTEELRDAAATAGVKNVVLQKVGGEQESRYMMRFEQLDKGQKTGASDASKTVAGFTGSLKQTLASYNPDVQRVDYVGPQVGKELQKQGAASLFYAVIGIFVYILLRFDMRFAPGAVVKMLQDVMILVGFYSFGWISFDLTSVAALLTVIGYSVNDTIVIYDRIRENVVLHPKRGLRENINISLNETLTRTINTSVTTLISLTGVLIFGASQIWNFAAAMALGVVVATISSMFLASSFVIWLESWKKQSRKKALAA